MKDDPMTNCNEDTPICQKCFDADEKLSRMTIETNSDGEVYPLCKICKTYYTFKKGNSGSGPFIVPPYGGT